HRADHGDAGECEWADEGDGDGTDGGGDTACDATGEATGRDDERTGRDARSERDGAEGWGWGNGALTRTDGAVRGCGVGRGSRHGTCHPVHPLMARETSPFCLHIIQEMHQIYYTCGGISLHEYATRTLSRVCRLSSSVREVCGCCSWWWRYSTCTLGGPEG